MEEGRVQQLRAVRSLHRRGEPLPVPILLKITESCVITGIGLVLEYQDRHLRWVCPSFPIE